MPRATRPPTLATIRPTSSTSSSSTSATAAGPRTKAPGAASWNTSAPRCSSASPPRPSGKHNADTYAYFGEPVYTYALKDGINDGFLTPFKVRQIATTLDEYVYTPDDEVLAGRGRGRSPSTPRTTSTASSKSKSASATGSRSSWSDRPAPEDPGVLRHPGPRPGRARPDQSDEDSTDPTTASASPPTTAPSASSTCALPGQREDHPDHPHHLAEALHRRGCPQHPPHRADAADQAP
jgi:hypothetical protein